MCDEVPSCLVERLVSFEGTSLVDPFGDLDGGMGGYCGVAPPTCRKEEDACSVLGPDPPYWTNVTQVSTPVVASERREMKDESIA